MGPTTQDIQGQILGEVTREQSCHVRLPQPWQMQLPSDRPARLPTARAYLSYDSVLDYTRQQLRGRPCRFVASCGFVAPVLAGSVGLRYTVR